MRKKVIKALFLFLAFLSVGLGLLGVVLPVLPTTPFLLLASYFFSKGSDRFHAWFVSTKLYDRYLAEFIRTRAMTRKRKWSILLPASAMLIASFLLVDNKYVRMVLPALMVFKYYYFFFRIRTIKEEEPSLARKAQARGNR